MEVETTPLTLTRQETTAITTSAGRHLSGLAVGLIVVAVIVVVGVALFLILWFTLPATTSQTSGALRFNNNNNNNNNNQQPQAQNVNGLQTGDHVFTVTASNNAFSYNNASATPNFSKTVTVESKAYNGVELALALQNALNGSGSGTWKVTYNNDSHKFTVATDSFQFSRCPTNNSIYSLIGFSYVGSCTAKASANSETGDAAF